MERTALEVRRADGWEEVVFEGATEIQVAGGTDGEALTLTLIGIREDRPNQVEAQILDVPPRHEVLLAGSIPRSGTGTALPLVIRSAD